MPMTELIGDLTMPSPLMRMYEAVQMFRELDSEIQAQAMSLFLCVAENPGITMQKAAKLLAVSQSSISRNAMLLSRLRRDRKPGLELLETRDNPDNLREKMMELTPKGKRLASQIGALID
jgi:DNA-binding MarR family transcriptional regulator